MKITELGLYLSKTEVIALLGFAGDSAELLQFYGVHFKSDGARVMARSTNGQIAAEADGECEGVTGEWFVHRDFLGASKKLLDNDTQLRLSFEGASLRDAVIVDENEVIRSTLSWPEDAAITQLSFPDVEGIMGDKPGKKKAFTTVSLNAEYLGLLKLISKAAGNCAILCSPPHRDGGPSIFACNGAETNWRAIIMPLRTEEAVDNE